MARAQAGVYVGYSATRMGGITCFDPQFSNSTNPCYTSSLTVATTSNNHVNPSGILFGGFYDLRNVGPVRLGVDLRYNHDRSNKSAADSGGGKNATGANTVLVGIRGSVHTPVKWLKPYAQISFGRTSSNVTEPFCVTTTGPAGPVCNSSAPVGAPRLYDSFFRYEGFVGADIRIAPVLDFRAIELGLGNMNRTSNSNSVPGSTTSVGLESIGVGLVFHLPTK